MSEGRDTHGRFTKGCKPGPGNPHCKSLAAWRSAMASAITAKDIREITKVMVKAAKDGSLPAAIQLLDRCVGRPVPSDLIDELNELEQLITELRNERARENPVPERHAE